MAKATMPLPTLSHVMTFLFLLITGGNVNFVIGQKTWCVANPSTAEYALLDNLHFACSIVDCSTILGKNGLCFYPDALISHASLAMNLYYQTKGRNSWNCHFNGTGLIVLTNPSYGKCKYA